LRQIGLASSLAKRLREQFPVEDAVITLVREGESAEEALERFWKENPQADFCLTLNIRNEAVGDLPDYLSSGLRERPGFPSEAEELVTDPDSKFKQAMAARDEMMAEKQEPENPFRGWHRCDIEAYLADVAWDNLTDAEKEVAQRLALHQEQSAWSWMI
jgi:hypothetical protein